MIGFFLSTWQIYISHFYLDISQLQGFQSLTSGDLKWPLTSTKNNRVLSLKSEKCRSLLSRDFVFTSRLRGFRSLISGNLKWPLTSTKNDRVLPLNMTNLYQPSLPWYIAITKFLVFDLWWPQMTFGLHQNHRVLSLNMTNLAYTKYEKCPSLLYRDIVITSFSAGDLKRPLTFTKK